MSPRPPTDPDSRLFNEVYAALRGPDARAVPWARGAPHPALDRWLAVTSTPAGHNRALVVGAGLGDDAEALAARGWQVIAFDAAPEAVSWARDRFPTSRVRYLVADLFAPSPAWLAAFDLVVEIHTIQALPPTRRQHTIAAIARLVAPGGILFVATFTRAAHDPLNGRPWPLTEHEIAGIARHGLEEIAREESPGRAGRLHVRFQRRANHPHD